MPVVALQKRRPVFELMIETGQELEKRIEAMEMCIYRCLLKIPWKYKVTNEEVLRRTTEEQELLSIIRAIYNYLSNNILPHNTRLIRWFSSLNYERDWFFLLIIDILNFYLIWSNYIIIEPKKYIPKLMSILSSSDPA